MPRRHRPVSRAPPKSVRNLHANANDTHALQRKRKVLEDSESDDLGDDRSSGSDVGEGEIVDAPSKPTMQNYGNEDDIAEDEEDADVPQLAQWVDEDELSPPSEGGSENGGDGDLERGALSKNLEKIQEDLSGLPLGALRRAQYTLRKAEVDSESESDNKSDWSNISVDKLVGRSKGNEKPEWCLKPKSEIPKRSNKHAPVEMSSKRPVTRRRQVVNVKIPQSRDPRFLQLTGEFSAEKFHNNYGFLIEARRNELNTLKENLKRARKLLLSSPRNQRNERENEVKRLELALKRTESLVNKDRQDKIQMEVLRKVTKEERDKRKQGKRGWWMKEGEKKKVVTEAKYKALAKEGGQIAVKKAMEKRQKKMGQKEKRKRPRIREREQEGRKRRRVE
ncbi:hypothetical protein AX15_001776 [Amanita polypyramis BW_CC]|nr:hypothetical protein AX15_001776 [Amanita polypyramis BW_CC]